MYVRRFELSLGRRVKERKRQVLMIATRIERMTQRDKGRKSEPLVERQRERYI